MSYTKSVIQIIFLATVPFAATHLHAASIQFSPDDQTVPLGSGASVDVIFADPGGELLGAYDLTIAWDPAILTFSSITFGSSLGAPLDSLTGSIPSAGELAAAEVSFAFDLSLLQDGSSNLVLFTLGFNTLAAGISPLTVQSALLSDETGFPITGVGLTEGKITVTDDAIPEPSTWLLLGGGLLLMALCSKRGDAPVGGPHA